MLFAKKSQVPTLQPVTQPSASTLKASTEPKNQMQPAPQPAQANETQDWQTYTDVKNRFTLKYPASWMIKPAKPGDIGGEFLEISPQNIDAIDKNSGYLIGVDILGSTSSYKDAKSWYQDNITTIDGYPGSSDKVLQINGNSAYFVQQVTDSYVDNSYVILHNGTVLDVFLRSKEIRKGSTDLDLSRYIPDLEKIAHSIIFIN